jgi:hypothetical protein
MKYDLHLLQQHLETNWEARAKRLKWEKGPTHKLHPDFSVLEFGPTNHQSYWIYSTLGMSKEREDEHLIELHMFSSIQDTGLLELLTVTASYHRNDLPLGLHHTVNFGRAWQDNSECDHGFISLPCLDGEGLKVFSFEGGHLHNLWLIPITQQERDFKIEHGWDALEGLFEQNGFNYLDAKRPSLV